MKFRFFIATLFLWATAPVVWSDDLPRHEEGFSLHLNSPVLASRGSSVLTFAEVSASIDQLPDNQRRQFLANPDRFSRHISNLLARKNLARTAIDSGLYEDDRHRARLVNALWAELSKIFEAEYFQDQLDRDYSVEAREQYIRNRERFRLPDLVSFSHILLSSEQVEDTGPDELIAGIEARLSQGEAFSDLAREFSADPSVHSNGGVFDRVEASQLDPAFAEGLSDLEIGQTATIRSGYGWHLVKLQGRTEGELQEFAAVREHLEQQARDRHHAQLFNEFIAQFNQQPLELPEGAVRAFLGEYDVSWD